MTAMTAMMRPAAGGVRAQALTAALLAVAALAAVTLTFSPPLRMRRPPDLDDNLNGGPDPSFLLRTNTSSSSSSRTFTEHGKVTSLFVQMGAYRGGPATFAVVGLSDKSLHDRGNPSFACHWRPSSDSDDSEPEPPLVAASRVEAHRPDWGLGRIYTVVVLNCTFPHEVGRDPTRRRRRSPSAVGTGGDLLVTARYGDSAPFSPPETFLALREPPGAYRPRLFSGRRAYPYTFLHCGPPAFGALDPARVGQWVAYHARALGPDSRFVVHDAGGVVPAVRAVLAPWERRGTVEVVDVRDEARFDGHYHNQFLILNDCLHRTRFLANWTLFFDMDEYLYAGGDDGASAAGDGDGDGEVGDGDQQDDEADASAVLRATMAEYAAAGLTQVLLPERRMSRSCAAAPETTAPGPEPAWVTQTLVHAHRRPRDFFKYAVQARHVYATGVHRTEQFEGGSATADPARLRFFHYHRALVNGEALCQFQVTPDFTSNATEAVFRSAEEPDEELVVDDTLAALAPRVQRFQRRALAAAAAAGGGLN